LPAKRDLTGLRKAASLDPPGRLGGVLEGNSGTERSNMVGAYYRRLVGDDKQEGLSAASAWSIWKASTSNFLDHNQPKKCGDHTIRRSPFAAHTRSFS